MRNIRFGLALSIVLAFVWAGVTPASAADSLSVSPGTVTITEGASAAALVTTSTASPDSATLGFFGKYLEVSVNSATAGDSLNIDRVASIADASVVSGAISIVGNDVFAGDGTFVRRIGTVSSTYNGGANNKVHIDLVPDSLFSEASSADTSTWSSWTKYPSSGSQVSTVGQAMLPDGGVTFAKLGGWTGAGGGSSSLFLNSNSPTVTNTTTITTHPGRYATSLAINLVMQPNGAVPAQGASYEGGGVVSPAFSAQAGDRISFEHRNCGPVCGASTPAIADAAVNVVVGLLDTNNHFVSAGHAVMSQDQAWDYYNIEVPVAGTYKLAIFAGGKWSATSNPTALNTFVKFDVFKMPPLTATMVANIFKKIEYQYTARNPVGTKTLKYTLGTLPSTEVSATQVVSFSLVDDAATPVDSSITVDNISGVSEDFSSVTGTFGGSDADSTLAYTAAGASNVTQTLSGVAVNRKLSTAVGDLYFNTGTGDWVFQPNATVLNSQSASSTTVAQLQLNSVPFTFTIATHMVPAPPVAAPSITVTTPTGQVVSPASTPRPLAPVETSAVESDAASDTESEATTTSDDEKTKKSFSLADVLTLALTDPIAALQALLAEAFAPPAIDLTPGAAVADAAIGASGDDSAPVVAFDPLGSPESIATLSGALVMAVSLAGGVSAAVAGKGGSSSSSQSSEGGAELDSMESAADVITISRKSWGDKLAFFSFAPMLWLDKFSHDAAVKVAPVSPMLSKMIIDGAYLRAMLGSLALIFPLANVVLAWIAAQSNHGQILTPPWPLFLAMAALGTFDAFAGFLGALVFIGATVVFASSPLDSGDWRLMFGVLFVSMGPGLLMTAFRALRKDVEPGFVGVWDRATDFVIAPLMAGVAVSTAVMVLPALSGLTLPVANHVADFGACVALIACVRVCLEELAAKGYPNRLNAINPSAVPSPGVPQQVLALIVSYGLWVFLTGALVGPVWQVWVGSLLFLIPTLLGKFSDSFPNSPTLWRILPQGIPGLVTTLVVSAFSASIVMAIIGANPAFASWNMVLLPLPLLVLSILMSFGREGSTPDEVRYSQRNPILFRVGGVVMFLVAIRLMGVI